VLTIILLYTLRCMSVRVNEILYLDLIQRKFVLEMCKKP